MPLLAACQALDGGFGAHLIAAQTLTPYATRYRYPDFGSGLEPPETEARQAVQLADTIVRFVHLRI